ncbi:unannotated protein [freshwater metagenome]|uniref:Unannotated protein n=1 Tax=freshwater metagenome TaxID=449393 RepID=A0A6J6I0T2_9ZZZZ
MLIKFPLGTCPNRKCAKQKIKCFPDCPRMWIRAKIPSSLVFSTPHHNSPGILFINSYSKEWVALVVAKPNIKSWAMLLNERVLKNKGLYLIAYLDPFDTVCGGHHCSCAWMQLRHILKIIRYARTQVCSFPHINHTSKFVLELVRTSRRRNTSCGRTFYRHCTISS